MMKKKEKKNTSTPKWESTYLLQRSQKDLNILSLMFSPRSELIWELLFQGREGNAGFILTPLFSYNLTVENQWSH